MGGAKGGFALGEGDDDGEFDFAGGYHVDVDVLLGKGLEEFGGDAGVAFHADADDGEFADFFLVEGLGESDLGGEGVDEGLGLGQVGAVDGEGEIGGWSWSVADVLYDHVDVDGGLMKGLEDLGGDAGLIGDAEEGDFGLVFVEGDASDDDVFHVGGFFFHDGSGIVVEAGSDFKGDAEFFGEFNGSTLHNFGARAGEFKHFVIGDFLEFFGLGKDAGVGGVNAVDVGVDLAKVGADSSGDGDGGKVGAAAAERGEASVLGLPLEAGDDDDVAGVKELVNLFGGDVLDSGFGVDAVGLDAGLGAGEGDGGDV